MKYSWIILAAGILFFYGCVMPQTPQIPDLELPVITVEVGKEDVEMPVPTSPLLEDKQIKPDSDEAMDKLQSMVEEELHLDKGALKLISVEAQTWRDASLGCPEPAMVYAQVLTEGMLVLYEDPEGIKIPVHVEKGLMYYVICLADSVEGSTEKSNDLTLPPAVQIAKEIVGDMLNASPAEIEVSDIRTVDWSSSCLGCAESGEACLTVITPGYQVQLVVDGRAYAVHTNKEGSAARLCEKIVPPSPSGD